MLNYKQNTFLYINYYKFSHCYHRKIMHFLLKDIYFNKYDLSIQFDIFLFFNYLMAISKQKSILNLDLYIMLYIYLRIIDHLKHILIVFGKIKGIYLRRSWSYTCFNTLFLFIGLMGIGIKIFALNFDFYILLDKDLCINFHHLHTLLLVQNKQGKLTHNYFHFN